MKTRAEVNSSLAGPDPEGSWSPENDRDITARVRSPGEGEPAGEAVSDKARPRFLGKQRITVSSASFRTAQILHAVGILLIPFLGTVAAIWLSLQNGIGILEIGLLVLFYMLSILGITVGFHRHFAHKSFTTTPAVRFALGILGSMAAQGPVTYWVSNHRRHHRYSDCDGDPHSPHVDGAVSKTGLRGFMHAHIGWTIDPQVTNAAAFSLDLLRDPLVCAINRSYYAWVLLGLLAPTIIGGLLTLSWQGALAGFLWGGLVRLFLAYHATNSINSLTHLFGSRPFETRDRSRNNILLVLPTLGEGLHNNHHAFPGSALFGYRWWHFDLGGWFVQAMERLGLAWDVQRPPLARVAGIATARGEANE